VRGVPEAPVSSGLCCASERGGVDVTIAAAHPEADNASVAIRDGVACDLGGLFRGAPEVAIRCESNLDTVEPAGFLDCVAVPREDRVKADAPLPHHPRVEDRLDVHRSVAFRP